jgi:hypothetical protein
MNASPLNPRAKPPLGIGGRLFVTLFFLFFFGLGSMFVGLIARDSWTGLRNWSWSATDCEITRSEVRQNNGGRRGGDFVLDLEYRYRVGGNTFVSNRLRARANSFADYTAAERLAESYPVGSHATCYVNPSTPNEAVLRRGSLLMPLLVLFPMIFVGIGAIGVYSAWRPSSRQPMLVRPISDRASGGYGTRSAMVFFGIFAALGAVIFFFVFLRPLAKTLSARQWPVVACTVISSRVESHSGNKGTTYNVNIFYRYIVNDREYRANRYGFLGGSSSGYAHKAAIVARYPAGSTAQCYVNPADPAEAVLERGFTPGMWLGLLPLVFVLFGLMGVYSVSKKRAGALSLSRLGPESASSGLIVRDAVPRLDPGTLAGTLHLKPQAAPLTKVLVILAFALFWNGLVSVFVFQVARHWRSGPFEWFLAVFLVPFVLIGLSLIGAVVYCFLGAFNPRPHLTVTPGAGRLGEALRVEWEISGRVAALRELCVRLQGREEVSYRQGDNTSMARNVFADLEIATQTEWRDMGSGSGTVTIPPQLMHSFAGQHNKVIWSIRVTGDIPRWPDLNEEFELTVLPAARNGQKN